MIFIYIWMGTILVKWITKNHLRFSACITSFHVIVIYVLAVEKPSQLT